MDDLRERLSNRVQLTTDALAAVAPSSTADIALTTETFWAALHGPAELERAGRIKPDARAARVALVVYGIFGH